MCLLLHAITRVSVLSQSLFLQFLLRDDIIVDLPFFLIESH